MRTGEYFDAARRGRLLAIFVCAMLAALGLAASARAAGPFAYGPEDLELVSSERLSDRLVELAFRTPAIERETRVRVLLPEGYDTNEDRRYPVLYLLHGCCGEEGESYKFGTENGDFQRITAGWPLIAVMPDSGPNWGYVDWNNQGAGGPPMWETYHLGQLLPWIDQHFRTGGTRQTRAVAGHSMGGYGAMHYAARHPDLFVAAASFSGAVNSNSIFLQAVISTDGLWWTNKKVPTSTFGPRQTEEVRWRGHNPWDLAENLDGLYLTLRTGNGQPGGPGGEPRDCCFDPVEAEVHAESVSLHRRLFELGVPHVWEDYGPACHCAFYLLRNLEQLMPDLARVFADPPPQPSPFDYKSIDPVYEIYGWKVAIDRPALEFSELQDVSRNAFTLRGSGTATVTTAPLYAPGREVEIKVAREEGVESERVAVADDCRLRLSVPLGPGNPYQQYTAQARADRALRDPRYAPSHDDTGTVVYTARVKVDAEHTPGCPRRAR